MADEKRGSLSAILPSDSLSRTKVHYAGDFPMMTRLTPYGSMERARNLAKVSADKGKTPRSLAARMPSPEIAAKVGVFGIGAARARRVVRRKQRG
jgi:hypothetical protein